MMETPITSRGMLAGLLAAAAACLLSVPAGAQVDVWTSTSSGLWGTPGNWNSGVPTNVSTATFNNTAGLQTSITLLSASTAGALSFLNSGGSNAYTFDTSGTTNADTLTLSTGITNSDAGAITFYDTTALAGAQTWTNNGGAITFNGKVNLGSGSSGYALVVGGSGAVNIAGIIANGGNSAGSLEYSGTNTLTLTAANTYTGATTIDSGSILQLGSGTVSGNIASSSGITDNGTLALDEHDTTTVANAITGTGGITKTGATVVLSGTNSYTGATVVNGGTLTASSTSALGNGSAVTVNTGAILGLTAGDSNTVGSIAGGGGITIGSSATTLTTGGNNTSTTFSGVISGSGGVTEAGTGTLTLTGANSFAGSTTINSGASVQLGNGTVNGTVAGNIADNGTLTLNEVSATTISKVISGSGTLTQVGASTTTLSGTNTFTGVTNINGGALSIKADNNLGAAPASATANSLNFSGGALDTTGTFALSSNRGVTLNAGGGTFVPSSGTTLTYGGIVAGTGALTMAGAGTLTLSGTNTYTGATNINSGTLGVGADANLGTAPGSATANSLNFNGGTLATTSPMTLNSNRGVTLNAGGGTFSPAALTSLTYGGVVAGTGALTVAGAGTLTLSGTNTYTGATNMNSGVLSIGADANLGAAPGSATANSLSFSGGTLSTTATFALNANRGMTVNTGGSPSSISVASGTTLTYGGLVGGSGSLLVPGAGTLDLTNNNLNFAGSATVTSGELELGGTLPSIGTLTLGTGSTLYLNGSDLSVTNLVISGNAIIDFGASASILNATNFTINGSSTLTVKDWADEVDYFYSQNWTGVTLGSRGTGQETHVTFNGYSSSSTGWLSYDKEISPAPEPAAYGAILVGISLLGVVVYRRKCSAA